MGWFLDSAALLFDSNFWVAMLVDAALKGALILIASALLIRLLKPSASIRHMIRALALTALILLPVCRLLIPPWQVDLLPRSPWQDPSPTLVRSQSVAPALEVGTAVPVPVEQTASAEREANAIPAHNVAPATSTPTAAATVSAWKGWSEADLHLFLQRWRTLLVLAWAAGFLFFLARLGVGMACVQMAVARARPLDQEGWDSIARQARRRLAISRPVRLLLSPQLEVALSVGYSRPTVLLPEIARTWSESRRRSILLHEFSHVKRWDNLTNLIAQLACALYWFNPLAWSASKALTVDRERACDDEVLGAGARASDYASHLLEIARALTVRRFWGRLELSQSSALKDRLTAVLNPRIDRRKPTLAGWMAVAALSGLAMAPLAAFQPWADAAAVQQALDMPSRQAELFALKRSRAPQSSPHGESPPALSVGRSGRTDPEASPPKANAPTGGQDYRDLLKWMRPPPLQGPNVTSVPGAGLLGGSAGLERNFSPFGGFLGASAPLANLSRPLSENTASFRPSFPIRFRDSSGGPPEAPPETPELPLIAEVARVDLGTLGGAESLAADINDLGFVVGESRNPIGLVSPFLWTARTGMVNLGNPFEVHTRALKINSTGQVLCETFNVFFTRGLVWTAAEGLVDIGGFYPRDAWTQVRAMNDRGFVVGSSRDGSGQVRAFIWSRQGGMIDLGVPGESEAWAVNERGQVAGYADQVVPTGVETRAFFWDPVQGLRFLRPEGSGLSIATALNNLGQVVGYAEFGDGPPRAFLWDAENGMRDLGLADESFPITLATGVNDLGQVVGRSLSSQGPEEAPLVQAFRWTQAEGMQHIGSAQDESLIAINAVGQIVGAYLDDVEASENPLSILWTESGRVQLEDEQATVVAINNRSQAVGASLNLQQEKHAFLWEVRLKRR